MFWAQYEPCDLVEAKKLLETFKDTFNMREIR